MASVLLNLCQILPSGLNVQGTDKRIWVKRCCGENVLDDFMVLDVVALGLSLVYSYSF